VEVGKSVELRVVSCESVDEGNGLATLVGTCEENDLVFNRSSEWSVNGTRGGSATMGRVTVGAGMATYTAPLQKPPVNPVAVSTRIATKKGKLLLVSNITVVDAGVGWKGTISYTMSGTKTITDSGSGPDGNFTSTETYSASGDSSITVADDNPFAAGFLRYTAGTGIYNYSRIKDYENTVRSGDCTYHGMSHEEETLSGSSSVQGTESGYVNLQPDGTYEIVFSTLGGDTAGQDVTTFSSNTSGQGCRPVNTNPTDYPQTGTIPDDDILSVKGIIDPKKPNVLHGNLPVVVDPDSFLPLTYTVTWDLKR
jgi:hypothetical protein